MATRNGLEPSTSSVTGSRSNQLNYRAVSNRVPRGKPRHGGNNRARTCDPLLVRQVLYQLSYAPSYMPPSRATLYMILRMPRFVNTFSQSFLNKFSFRFRLRRHTARQPFPGFTRLD